MKKNDYFYGECVDLTYDGQGIVKVDNFTYFVKGMLVGETGKLKVIKVLKNYAIARLIELDQVSPYRSEPKCAVFKACGGCQLQHINQQGQQKFKTKRVIDCLERIGDCHVLVNDCLMMEEPWHYRNKVQMPLGIKNNHLVTGFYKKKSNEIIPCDNCLIQNKLSNQITNRVRELMEQFNIHPYDKMAHQGNIKHILTKQGYHTNEVMLVLISYQDKIKHIDKLVQIITQEFPMIKTVIQNINPRVDNVILGDIERVLYGDGYIYDYLLGNKYKISLKSFYQINPVQVEKLYQTAIDFANLNDNNIVLDAYCGIGTIALSLARHVKKVYGVEIVPEAIEDAKFNASNNQIENVEFYCDDAGRYMMELVRQGIHLDVVFVDPPRKGCSNEFLDYLIKATPEKIVYISCDVATQARDIKYLQEHGYIARKCQPVDMFPQTTHIENIVLLTK
ncbi:23S rRNA (uracil(1939)-C(5))-methyltransferase RlmD [uncultured Thomasclavelia sp.]|uniref:23S rRNA (uracil(1939)-C(5))-methyltransferase RlmD n=1 Tax=uncultured Thomasclavelia sp. TaxID=3025759 RepID=UPI0025CF64EF|nr:23S rRNA (uracil(1939)-C(5))-methyltransferase RlmD [uncultured Thomasclavelia sp.]